MSNVTSKLVTPARLGQLLDCYGSSPSSWPADERQAALNLLQRSAEQTTALSAEMRELQDETRSLDKLLAQTRAREDDAIDQHAVQALQQRIMRDLPEQEPPVRHINTAANETRDESVRAAHHSRFWMGSIAASLLIVSLSLGVIHQLSSPEHEPVAQNNNDSENQEFAQWAWEDITGESLAVDTDNDVTTMLALVELELPAE